MKKIIVVISLALGLALGIWNTSGKAQVEGGKDKKTKNKIRIQYLSEGQSRILAERWIEKELQGYKQNNDPTFNLEMQQRGEQLLRGF